MDKLARIATPMSSLWARLNPLQKATVSMAALLAVVGLVLAVNMAGRPQYAVLFSNLAPNDANAIVEKLKETKVPYRVASNGSTVEVPEKDVYELRLQFAGEGIPQGGNVGFEIFDKSAFGMTEFTQKLNYKRALQGELSKTISDLAPIDQARVHLVIPDENLYAEQQQESSASVVIKLRAGAQLDADQASAITHLVSAAVEGLKPNAVALVDTAGTLLSDASSSAVSPAGARQSLTQLQTQKQFEANVARDLQAMLEKVLGPGKAIVRVNARMNFDAKESDNEVFEPGPTNQGVLIKQDQLNETYRGGPRNLPNAPALNGALGAPGGAVTRETANGDNYNRTQTNAQYAVTRRVEHVVQAPGKVERMSVAVLVDGVADQATVQTIQDAVSSASGIDAARGDQISVASMKFDNSALQNQDKEMKDAARMELWMALARYGVAVVLGIVFLLVLRALLARWNPVEVTREFPKPLPLEEMEALDAPETLDGAAMLDLMSEEPALPVHTGPSPIRAATEMAQEDPEGVAKLVRSWLSEE